MRLTAENTVANRLQDLARQESLDLSGMPDAFHAPESWMPAATVVEQRDELAEAVEDFKEDHQLGAVMVGGDSGYAVVDGKGLHIGQELEGFTLVAVHDDAAVFEMKGVQVELKLDRAKYRVD